MADKFFDKKIESGKKSKVKVNYTNYNYTNR